MASVRHHDLVIPGHRGGARITRYYSQLLDQGIPIDDALGMTDFDAPQQQQAKPMSEFQRAAGGRGWY